MTRLGWLLAGLAVALTIPVAILVVRALGSAAVEEQARHRLVADRAFDEMEATLSRFLAEEEARPPGAYRFYPEGAPPVRSPLAEPPREPFVVGYFQIDPDGSFHTPRIPRNAGAAEERGDFTPTPETEALPVTLETAWREAEPPRKRPPPVRRIEESVPLAAGERLYGQASADAGSAEAHDLRMAEPEEAMQILADRPRSLASPGTSAEAREALEKEASRPKAPPMDDAEGRAASDDDGLDSYSIYRSFNLAQKRRQERQAKVERVPQKALAFESPAPARVAPPAPAPAAAAPGPIADETPERDTVRALLEPMLGRAVPGDRLILYRTVLAGDQALRQGLLVDWRGLGRWLHEQVVAPSALGRAQARTRFVAAGSALPEAATADGYLFRHRFAEPFDAFAVELTLPSLSGGRGTGTIWGLAAMVALVGAGGLFAVYRMASVALHFAEQRSRFAASVSHELKTPLTSIRMYAEMLRDGLVPGDEKRAEYYHTITDESERLSRLIDNVLEFSRLERGESELRPARGDLAQSVREAVAKLRPHAERLGFTLRETFEADPVEAVFDPDAVTQIVFNTVDNALKYARDARVREVEVACSVDGPDALLRVRDHGPGIPDPERGRVFEPFYRGEEEATRSTRGSGIGLALVRELAESMGGSARARNADGGGLEISVRLPRVPSA